ncbi:MAG: hypothetical protein OHK0012_14890 [Synechococcales cyanobacterium]
MQAKAVGPILLLVGLVYIGYGDKIASLPSPARILSAQVRTSVGKAFVNVIPKDAPKDERYDRSWQEVDSFDSYSGRTF